jgi:RecQ-mediated genome instability protein 1
VVANLSDCCKGSQLTASMAHSLVAELTQHLNSRHLHPTTAWLQSFVSTTRPNTPMAALKQTALFRLLATDITTALTPPANTVFPVDVLNARVPARTVAGPIVCQVLDIDDIGLSRWAQVEAIEAKERGETTKGREIVRVVENENDGTTVAPAVQSKGPFKLLLQDAKGVKVYALDLRGIEGVNTSMTLGAKLVLRNVDVRRAVAMLEPSGVQVLGGKLEALDKAWKDGRKERLINAAKTAGEITT